MKYIVYLLLVTTLIIQWGDHTHIGIATYLVQVKDSEGNLQVYDVGDRHKKAINILHDREYYITLKGFDGNGYRVLSNTCFNVGTDIKKLSDE